MKRRRIPLRAIVPITVVLAAGVWGVTAIRGLDDGTVYYYNPSELSSRRPGDEVIRVGGQVVPGSVRWDPAGVLRFQLTDGSATVNVQNRGAPPQLFRGGVGAIVEGRLAGGTLRSNDVIVKHDQNYRAPGPTQEGTQ